MMNGIDHLVKDFEEKNKDSAFVGQIDSNALWKGMLDIVSYLQTYQIYQKRYGVEFIRSQNQFYTSDNPVIHIGKRDNNGFAIETKYLYPVTPSLCIIFPSNTK